MPADRRDRQRRASRWLQWFYYAHVPFLIAAVFVLDFEAFTKVSLLYTTTVSAVTAGATYGARLRAEEARDG